MEKLITLLKRLGVDPKFFLENNEVSADFSETAIIQAVLANPANYKEKIDEAIKKQDAILVGKITKEIRDLGVEQAQIDGANGDIKTLVKLGTDKIKTDSGLDKNELSTKYQEAQKKLRELELSFNEKEESYKSKMSEIEKQKESEISIFKQKYQTRDTLLKIGLTETAVKGIDFFADSLFSKINSEFDFLEENGKKLAYKKGTQDKVWRGNSSDQETFESILESHADSLGIKKKSAVGGGGNPGGGSDDKHPEQVFNRYA